MDQLRKAETLSEANYALESAYQLLDRISRAQGAAELESIRDAYAFKSVFALVREARYSIQALELPGEL